MPSNGKAIGIPFNRGTGISAYPPDYGDIQQYLSGNDGSNIHDKKDIVTPSPVVKNIPCVQFDGAGVGDGNGNKIIVPEDARCKSIDKSYIIWVRVPDARPVNEADGALVGSDTTNYQLFDNIAFRHTADLILWRGGNASDPYCQGSFSIGTNLYGRGWIPLILRRTTDTNGVGLYYLDTKDYQATDFDANKNVTDGTTINRIAECYISGVDVGTGLLPIAGVWEYNRFLTSEEVAQATEWGIPDGYVRGYTLEERVGETAYDIGEYGLHGTLDLGGASIYSSIEWMRNGLFSEIDNITTNGVDQKWEEENSVVEDVNEVEVGLFLDSRITTSSVDSSPFGINDSNDLLVIFGGGNTDITDETLRIEQSDGACSYITDDISPGWHRFKFVWDTDRYKIYVDGNEKAVSIYGTPVLRGEHKVSVGHSFANLYTESKLGYLRVNDTILYQNGQFHPSIANSGSVKHDFVQAGKSFNLLNGCNQYLDISSDAQYGRPETNYVLGFDEGKKATFHFRVKPNLDGGNQYIISAGNFYSAETDYWIRILSSSIISCMGFHTSFSPLNTLQSGEWYDIWWAIEKTATNIIHTISINGDIETRTFDIPDASVPSAPLTLFGIGVNPKGAESYLGEVDVIEIYDGVAITEQGNNTPLYHWKFVALPTIKSSTIPNDVTMYGDPDYGTVVPAIPNTTQDALGNPITNDAGLVHNGCSVLLAQSPEATQLLDSITVVHNGVRHKLPYDSIWENRPRYSDGEYDVLYGLVENERWYVGKGSVYTYNGEKSTGKYPDKDGWNELESLPVSIEYSSNWIDDNGYLLNRSYENFRNTINLTGEELSRWKIMAGGACGLEQQIVYKQGTVDNFTEQQYNQAVSWAGEGSCQEMPELLRDANGEVILDANGENIYVREG